MVRCEEFYKYFERKGNFCNKSNLVVKKVEDYIDYVKRNRLREYGGYRISNNALDPLINIETEKGGKVHSVAIKELKSVIRRGKILPEKVTRRVVIELINKSNEKVDLVYKLDRIPNIRSKIGEYEHEISEVGFEVRDTFNALKADIDGDINNNEAMQIMLEVCIRNPELVRSVKAELESKKESDENNIKIVEVMPTRNLRKDLKT